MTMTLNDPAAGGAARQAASRLPRLLPLVPGVPEDLRTHLARYGRPPYRGNGAGLIEAVEAAGLTGRGGAAFPVHRKLAAVAAGQGRKVLVANGSESEPASHKDAVLLRAAPNLVLDGLQLAAEAIGAAEAHLYLHYGPHARDLAGPGRTGLARPGPASRHGHPGAARGSWPARRRHWSTGSAAGPRCPPSSRRGSATAAWAARPPWSRTWRPWLTWP